MQVLYGEIVISARAEEEVINGPDELALSDRFYELETKFEEWLKQVGAEFPEFILSVGE